MRSRLLAITMGDPAGIGPEIIVKACLRLKDRIDTGELRLVIIGSGRGLRQALRQFGGGYEIPEGLEGGVWLPLCYVQAGPESKPIETGKLSAEGGRFAYLAVERGVRLAESGRIDAIVTAPLNKEALNKAGYHYAGHTEMLADLTGVRGSVMMLVHGNMRVSHVSTH